jgi:replicative DNA helicase
MTNIQQNIDGNQAALSAQANILAHIQDGAFPPFPGEPIIAEIKPCDFSRFSRHDWGGLDLSQIGVGEITPDFLPEWLSEFCKAVAANTQTPVTMATLLVLSTLATVLHGKARVRGRTKKHEEELMIWTVTALPPGNLKSPVFKAVTQPLIDFQIEEGRKTEPEREARNEQIDIAKKRIEKLRKEASEVDDPEFCLQEIAKLKEVLKTAIPKPQLFISKGTMEAIRDMLKHHDEKIGVLSAEGGLFDLICGLYNNGHSDIDLLLNGYFAEYYNDNRAGSIQYELEHPRISIGLTVQPVTLQSLAKGGSGVKGQVRDRGLLGRFIFGVPLSLVGQRNDENDPPEILPQIEAAYKNGLMRLLKLLPTHEDTPQGDIITPVLVLDTDAKQLFKSFWLSIEKRHGTDANGRTDDRDLAAIQDWTTKTQGSVLRVAGLIHFAKYFEEATKREIEASTMRSAINFYNQAIPHAQAAYAMMGDTEAPTNKYAKALYEWLKGEKREFLLESDLREPNSEVAKTMSKFASKSMTAATWRQTLSVLERAGVISGEVKVDTKGRPALARLINPSVYL